MNPLLRIRGLRVGDPRRPRLRGIDLDLERGDRLGLLGENGAGKSSLLLVLAGVLAPTAGSIEIDGLNGRQALRRHIGFLPQRVACYPELTVRENLDWSARLHGLDRHGRRRAIDRALARVTLGPSARTLAGQLSAGMQQRLGLAQALIHDPSILLLDEPTASLDPIQTTQIRQLIEAQADSVSVILATHLFDDIREICQRVAIIADGAKVSDLPVTPDLDLMAFFQTPRSGAA